MIGEYLDGLAVEKAMAFFLAVFLLASAAGVVVDRIRGRDGQHLSSDDRRSGLRRDISEFGAVGAGEAGRGDDLAAGGRVALSVVSGGRANETDIKVEEV